MFNRAQELDRNGQTDQAIDMLKKVVKVYKDTPTANEAKAALDRSEKNLPLFATGPIVVAEARKAGSGTGRPPPPAVVDAKPSEGRPRVRPRWCCPPTPPRRSWFHRRSDRPPARARA